MTIQEVIKKLKTAGYKAEKRARKSRGDYVAIIVEPKTDRSALLKNKIAPLLRGVFKREGNFSHRGEVAVGNVMVVAKEATKVSLVGFDARLFTKGGQLTTLNYQGKEVRVHKFTNANQIRNSIIGGVKSNKSLKDLEESIERFFDGGQFEWDDVDPAVVNKLAVYLGEVLVGWAAMSGQTKFFVGTNPFTDSKPVEFYVPDDPMFSGVDSIFRLKNGNLVAISSKSGAGRPGSFFSNILPAAMKMNVKGRTLKQLVNVVNRKSFKPTDAKGIVYEWGVNTLLHMNVSNPTQIVEDLKANKKGKLVYQVSANLVDAMKPYQGDPSAKERLDKLPMSITSCFNYLLAKKLEDSEDDVQNALVAKDYYQANLNNADFQKGKLSYSLRKAGKSEVKLIFKQSSMVDPAARNGWVNYEIRRG